MSPGGSARSSEFRSRRCRDDQEPGVAAPEGDLSLQDVEQLVLGRVRVERRFLTHPGGELEEPQLPPVPPLADLHHDVDPQLGEAVGPALVRLQGVRPDHRLAHDRVPSACGGACVRSAR
jgi:hypothetical protein